MKGKLFATVLLGISCVGMAAMLAGCGHTHNLTKTEGADATCTQDGCQAYWTCDGCDGIFADAEGKTPTTAEGCVIPSVGHSLSKVEGKASTCTQAGYLTYWVCESCGTFFSDEEGKTETTAEAVVLPLAEHVNPRVEYEWADDYSSCTARLYCENEEGVALEERAQRTWEAAMAVAKFESPYFSEQGIPNILNAVGAEEEILQSCISDAIDLGGYRELFIHLPEDASHEELWMVRRAIEATSAEEGEIFLTLTGITELPDCVDEVGKGGFGLALYDDGIARQFGELRALFLPDVTRIGANALNDSTCLEALYAPKAVTIGEGAFYYSGLTSLHLPKATAIGNYAFQYTQLERIDLPEVQVIGDEAFAFTQLKTVTLPKAQTIGDNSFSNSLLTQVTLSEAIEIGDGAFSNNPLETVTLPKATSLGKEVFYLYDSGNLTVYLLAEGEITLDGTFETSAAMGDWMQRIKLVLNGNKQSEVDGRTWQGYTFGGILYTCIDGTASHTQTVITGTGHGYHSVECQACNLTMEEVCYGGQATCMELADCSVCGEKHGEKAEHVMDAQTGLCQYGCGETVASVKLECDGTVTYYDDESLYGFSYTDLTGVAQAKVTLLKEEYVSFEFYETNPDGIVITIDLNGFYYPNTIYARENQEIVVINGGKERAFFNIAKLYLAGGKMVIGEGVDAANIDLYAGTALDLTNADFDLSHLIVQTEGVTLDQIVLGGYGLYNEDGEIAQELQNRMKYTVRQGVVKVAYGEKVYYFDEILEAQYFQEAGATSMQVKLLADPGMQSFEWETADYSVTPFPIELDTYGFDVDREIICKENQAITVINSNYTVSNVQSVVLSGENASLKIGVNVFVEAIDINSATVQVDLTQSNAPSIAITVWCDGLTADAFSLGGYKIFDADGNIVTGALEKGETYMVGTVLFTASYGGQTKYFSRAEILLDYSFPEDAEVSVTLMRSVPDDALYLRGAKSFTVDVNGHYFYHISVENCESARFINSSGTRNDRSNIMVGAGVGTASIGAGIDLTMVFVASTSATVDLSGADFEECLLSVRIDGVTVAQFVLGEYKLCDYSGAAYTDAYTFKFGDICEIKK